MFANGAATAAMSYAFGSLAGNGGGNRESVTGCGSRLGCAPDDSPWLPEYLESYPGTSDPMLDATAVDALSPLRLREDGEWVGYVQFRGPVGYVASEPQFLAYQERGNALVVEFSLPRDAVAVYHTHPAMNRDYRGARAFNSGQNSFGPRDHHVVYRRGIPNYLKMPNQGISVLEMQPIGALPRTVVPPRRRW